jgi:hypothetical protein
MPADPAALTHHVLVPAEGGRPGISFWAPGPSQPSPFVGPDENRMEAVIRLTRTAHILVARLGPLSVRDPAAVRPHNAMASMPEGSMRLDRITLVQTGAGPAHRHTIGFLNGKRITDWHLDFDGWAYAVGFLRSPEDENLFPVVERVLGTWQWFPGRAADPGLTDALA